jgi:hypothetical protein
MPIKDRDLSADQKKQAAANNVDELALQAEHEAAIEAKDYDYYSSSDYRVKLKQEQKQKRDEARKLNEQNLTSIIAQNAVNKSFSTKVRENQAKTKKSDALISV